MPRHAKRPRDGDGQERALNDQRKRGRPKKQPTASDDAGGQVTPDGQGASDEQGASDGQVTPDGQGAVSDEPVIMPDEPGTAPDEPGTIPDEPGTAPDEPVTVPDEPGDATPEQLDPRLASLDKKSLSLKWLTQKQLDALAAQGITFHTGPFSQAEDKRIMDATREFEVLNNIPHEAIVQYALGKAPHPATAYNDAREDRYYNYVTLAVENRTINSVRSRTKRLLHPNAKDKPRPWSQDDVQRLKHLIFDHGSKWDTVAEALGRTPIECFSRFKEFPVADRVPLDKSPEQLSGKVPRGYVVPETKSGPFSQEERDTLNTIVTETFPHGHVNWTYVASRLPNRSPTVCKRTWEFSIKPRVVSGDDMTRWSHVESSLLVHFAGQQNVHDKAHLAFSDAQLHPRLRTFGASRCRWVFGNLFRSAAKRLQTEDYAPVVEYLLRVYPEPAQGAVRLTERNRIAQDIMAHFEPRMINHVRQLATQAEAAADLASLPV